MVEQASPRIKQIIGLVISWLLAAFFALIGIVAVFSEPIPGLVMLIMAVVVLPPVTKIINQKWNYHLSVGLKVIVIIIGFIIFGSTIDTSNVANRPKVELANTPIEQQKTVTKKTTASCVPVDDLTTFTCRYGAPTEDYNTADEKPQPLIITRLLTYRNENVRAIYVPTTNEAPYEKWKLVAFQDPTTLKSISPEEVVERMKARDMNAK
jgi:hypothetical protein